MRLEHLRVCAFGPFAGTVEVDFAELSDAGLFLLTGSTGAGKSSVLDAVCFALYGVVPGGRSDAKHLRSDHAEPGAVPEVELRAAVGGRTFTFRRTAQWERPKKRGVGTMKEQPTVCIEELVGGSWQTLATRMDDAGHLVTELLGMTATQFTQVALLPQGGFQKFLHASSQERHEVLQRLFRTDRFERIEHWLAEHRRQLRRDSDGHAAAVTAFLQRISEVAGEPVPELLGEQALSPGDAPIAGWAADRMAHAQTRLETARSTATAAEQAHASARAAHDAALALARARARAHDARAVLTALEATADEATRRAHVLGEHRRAAPLRALSGQARDAEHAHTAAREPIAALAGAAGLDTPTAAGVAPLLSDALDEVAAARAASPLEQRLADAAKELRADRCPRDPRRRGRPTDGAGAGTAGGRARSRGSPSRRDHRGRPSRRIARGARPHHGRARGGHPGRPPRRGRGGREAVLATARGRGPGVARAVAHRSRGPHRCDGRGARR